jgi:N-acetylglucosaminyldiphosphoundecaprenol N-acetyl-beta-D-mannosaminyltransferase
MTPSTSATQGEPVENVLGYPVWASSSAVLAQALAIQLDHGSDCRWLACLNPHSYAVALDDADFHRALHTAHWLTPDGVGIVIASKLQGGEISARITGFDAFMAVNNALQQRGGSVFFLGSSEDTLASIRQRMAQDYPAVRVAGCLSPPYREQFSATENQQMVDAVNASGADVLWLAMTAPKQEKWLAAHADRLDVRFAGAIGAVFDFYAGKVQRSPPVFQRLGLEWLPRLLREPRRLWRRMFVSAPIFLWHALRGSQRPPPSPPQN